MDCFLIVVDCVFIRIIGCSFLSSSFFLCIVVGLFFCCIQIMVCVLIHNNCPKLRQGQADYAFRAYGEFCNFVYCLLLKTRSTSGLPEIHAWESYMDVVKVRDFAVVPCDSFLSSHDLGEQLSAGKTKEYVAFRLHCRQFVDRLIIISLESTYARSVIAKGMCSFCPELMLEGDDVAVFSLFADLCRILVSCGSLSVDESSAALEEHTSFIVEKRGYHSSSGQSAGDIVDVVPYLLRDVGFLSRPHLLRVFKLCCLVSGVAASRYPAVSLDLSGFALSVADIQSCVQLVQSYILSEGYSHQSFFSDQTLKVVKKAIADAGRFFGATNFSMWTEFCGEDVDAFVAKYSTLFTTFVAVRRKSFDARYVEYNNANRMSRLSESGDTAGSSGSLSSVIQRKRQDTGPPSVVSVNSGGSKSSNGGTKSGSKSAIISSKVKQQKNVGGNSGDGAGSSKGRKKAVRDADDDGSGSQPKPKKVSKNC